MSDYHAIAKEIVNLVKKRKMLVLVDLLIGLHYGQLYIFNAVFVCAMRNLTKEEDIDYLNKAMNVANDMVCHVEN